MDELLTGEENLQLMADLHRLRADEGKRVVTSLLERFDLVESAQKMAATYSGSSSWRASPTRRSNRTASTASGSTLNR